MPASARPNLAVSMGGSQWPLMRIEFYFVNCPQFQLTSQRANLVQLPSSAALDGVTVEVKLRVWLVEVREGLLIVVVLADRLLDQLLLVHRLLEEHHVVLELVVQPVPDRAHSLMWLNHEAGDNRDVAAAGRVLAIVDADHLQLFGLFLDSKCNNIQKGWCLERVVLWVKLLVVLCREDVAGSWRLATLARLPVLLFWFTC